MFKVYGEILVFVTVDFGGQLGDPAVFIWSLRNP